MLPEEVPGMLCRAVIEKSVAEVAVLHDCHTPALGTAKSSWMSPTRNNMSAKSIIRDAIE